MLVVVAAVSASTGGARDSDGGAGFSARCLLPQGGPTWSPPSDCAGELLEYARGGGADAYSAAVQAAGDAAVKWLAGQRPAPGCTELAVFDIDETVISNLHVLEELDFKYDRDTWNKWVQSASAPPLAPVKAAYEAIFAAGYSVAFVTGRHGDERDATQANLKFAGLGEQCGEAAPQCGGTREGGASVPACYRRLVLRETPEQQAMFASTYKPQARAVLEEELNVTVAALMGDQWSDLSGAAAGVASFKIANPFYAIL